LIFINRRDYLFTVIEQRRQRGDIKVGPVIKKRRAEREVNLMALFFSDGGKQTNA
jgi:hypothetical protein